MSNSSAGLAALGVAVMLTALSGCGSDMYSREPPQAPPDAANLPGIDALVAGWDADLGEEGLPLDRQALEDALRTDGELREALLGTGGPS